jgi:CheY-like chemotaxis protein
MSEPLRLLLVEDSEADAKLVIAELRRAGRSVESHRVEDAESMQEAL